MRLDQHYDVGGREVERERRNVVRQGVIARCRAVGALPIPYLRDTGFHRADEVVEIAAEVIRKQSLAADDREQPLNGVALLVGPAPCISDDLQDVFGRAECRSVAVPEVPFAEVAMSGHELGVGLLETRLAD